MKLSQHQILWIRAAVRRCIIAMAQTAIATLGAHKLISEIDWKVTASAVIMAGVISLLTSLVHLPEVPLQEKLNEQ